MSLFKGNHLVIGGGKFMVGISNFWWELCDLSAFKVVIEGFNF